MAAKKKTTSEETRTFGDKLRACYEDLAYLQKGGTNTHFNYKFVEESAVKKAVNETLRKNGLYLLNVSCILKDSATPKEAVAECMVTITDGTHTVVAQGVGGGVDSGDKAPMKANAAALKYALTSAFLIATGDDPEADEKTDAPKNKPKARKSVVGGKPTTLESLVSEAAEVSNLDELNALKSKAARFSEHPKWNDLKAAVKAAAKRLDV